MPQTNAKPSLVPVQKSAKTPATVNKANKKRRRPKPPADLETLRIEHRGARRAFLEVTEEASRFWPVSELREKTRACSHYF